MGHIENVELTFATQERDKQNFLNTHEQWESHLVVCLSRKKGHSHLNNSKWLVVQRKKLKPFKTVRVFFKPCVSSVTSLLKGLTLNKMKFYS